MSLSARGIATAWNDFWFAPGDPRVVGFLRLTLGLVLLTNHLNVANGRAYLANWETTEVVDISTPQNPPVLSTSRPMIQMNLKK